MCYLLDWEYTIYIVFNLVVLQGILGTECQNGHAVSGDATVSLLTVMAQVLGGEPTDQIR